MNRKHYTIYEKDGRIFVGTGSMQRPYKDEQAAQTALRERLLQDGFLSHDAADIARVQIEIYLQVGGRLEFSFDDPLG